MLINGIPQETISITDRALAYGDGLFETIRLSSGNPVYLEAHLQRLQDGCQRLGINLDLTLLKEELVLLSSQYSDYGVLKIIITRGAGGRGYRSDNTSTSNRILSLHALPDYSQIEARKGIQTFLCQQRLAFQPSLAGIKHLNRLEQVLASQEWPSDEYEEGFMLDTDGYLIEGTKSNIFFVEEGCLFTPDLSNSGVNGIMRQTLIAYFEDKISVQKCSLEQLARAEEVFVCNSVFGIWPVSSLTANSKTYHYSPAEYCQQAQQVFLKALAEYAN